MASVEAVKEVLMWLSGATVGREFSQPLFDLWMFSFEDVDNADLKQAALEYAKMNRFFPVPIDLLRLLGKAPMKAGLAWAKVGELLEERLQFSELPHEIRRVLKAMGGVKYVREQPTKDMRITFFQMYESISDEMFVSQTRERARLSAPVLIKGLLEDKDHD